VFGRPAEAALAHHQALAGGQRNLHQRHLREPLKDLPPVIAESRRATPLGQRLPQQLSQKATQDVRLHALLLLVLNGSWIQIDLVNAKRGFGFGELDVG
jgi:hypothetical protein